jgi:hypothetical protein
LETIPNTITKLARPLLGDKGLNFFANIYDYVVNQRNPILQVSTTPPLCSHPHRLFIWVSSTVHTLPGSSLGSLCSQRISSPLTTHTSCSSVLSHARASSSSLAPQVLGLSLLRLFSNMIISLTMELCLLKAMTAQPVKQRRSLPPPPATSNLSSGLLTHGPKCRSLALSTAHCVESVSLFSTITASGSTNASDRTTTACS